MKSFRDIRVIPVVLIAVFGLAVLKVAGLVIDGGYGKIKGKTLRISNMGDETDASIAELLRALDSALAELPAALAKA